MPLLRSAPYRALALALLLTLAPQRAALAASNTACGILVSTTGTDAPGCGLDPATPCRTVQYGITRAAVEGLSCVFVQTGLYNEVLVLTNGIQLYGGFNNSWLPGSISDPAHQSRVVGAQDNGAGGAGEFLTVRAANLFVPARITDMILEGPDATGTVSGNGRSSYVVHANGAALTLERVQLRAGNGAAGTPGASGLDAVTLTAAMTGGDGGAGVEQVDCNGSSHGAGGSAGANTCGNLSARNPNGGAGGAGGEMDTSCPFSLTATPGDPGLNAAFVSGSAGLRGLGGPANSSGCNSGLGTSGASGNPGLVANGAAGAGGTGAAVVGGFWSAAAGSAGTTGENGGGGGGGGGSGGCDEGTDSWGAGGGGGGAGGCAARGGGGAGGGGGGSFAVFAVAASSVSLLDCQIVRGTAGNGASGGTGGRGQPGGAGGGGGAHFSCSAAGNGGAGAHGGHGGGGGGGAGGASYAIATSASSSVSSPGLIVSGGAVGIGGAGGVSAPSAPVAQDDGNDGQGGVAGSLGTTLALGAGPEPVPAVRPAAAPAVASGAPAPCDIGCFTLDVPGDGGAAPTLAFAGVFPNPLARASSARFSLPREAHVTIEIFDPVGRRVATLCDRAFEGGTHAVEWNGRLEDGRGAANGVYVFRLEALGRTLTRRAVVLH